MLYLALARYRLLTSIRRSTWIFAIAIIAALFLLPFSGSLSTREMFVQASVEHYTRRSSATALFTFLFHWLVMISACGLFGERGWRESQGDDLMATVPVRRADRFYGDALGIFAAAMVLHLSSLPLLAFSFALSSFTTGAFLWLEVALVVVLAVFSGIVAWTLQTRPGRMMEAGAGAGFTLIGFVILRTGTRWDAFGDAFGEFIADPAPYSWARVVSQIDSPALLVTWLFLACAAQLTFYLLYSVYRRETDQ